GSTAKRIYSPDYPWAPTWERRVQAFDEVERNWTTGLGWEDIAPSLDAAGLAELSRYYRRCASPGAALALMKMNTQVDVRDVLPRAGDRPLHRHRRLDRAARRDGRRGLGGAARPPPRRRAARARALPRTRGRQCRRRLPRDLRRPGTCDPLGGGHPRRGAPA